MYKNLFVTASTRKVYQKKLLRMLETAQAGDSTPLSRENSAAQRSTQQSTPDTVDINDLGLSSDSDTEPGT